MSYLQLYEPNDVLSPDTISFASDLPHCGRCYNYLKLNNFYVPQEQTEANTLPNGGYVYQIAITGGLANTIKYPWSLPNYSFTEPELMDSEYVDKYWRNITEGGSKLNEYGYNYFESSNLFLTIPDPDASSPFTFYDVKVTPKDLVPPKSHEEGFQDLFY